MNNKIVNVGGVPVVRLDNAQKETIIDITAHHTQNTWQPGRGQAEIMRDTLQGKVAEGAFEEFLSQYPWLGYITYDSFRQDNGLKHAPFDGLLYDRGSLTREAGAQCLRQVVLDIHNDPYGRLTDATREMLRENHVITVEIKSTEVNNRKRQAARKTPGAFRDNLFREIRSDDFLYYPKYLRCSGDVQDFAGYCRYVKEHVPGFRGIPSGKIPDALLKEENAHAADLLIRVYIYDTVAMLMGYAWKEELFAARHIKHFFKPGKSEKALYFALPISQGHSCLDLPYDGRVIRKRDERGREGNDMAG